MTDYGPFLIVLAILAIPPGVLISGAIGSAIMGALLKRNSEAEHAGSELIDTNY